MTFHYSIQSTPFKLVYGLDHLSLIIYKLSPSPLEAMDTLLVERNNILKKSQGIIIMVYGILEMKANKNCMDLNFKEKASILTR